MNFTAYRKPLATALTLKEFSLAVSEVFGLRLPR
jgi:hypothetical protein